MPRRRPVWIALVLALSGCGRDQQATSGVALGRDGGTDAHSPGAPGSPPEESAPLAPGEQAPAGEASYGAYGLIELLPGGTGYGVVSRPYFSPDQDVRVDAGRIEILTAAGESCGTLPLQAPPCSTFSIGRDGTVFATTRTGLTGDTCAATDVTQTCTWRWWPALLRPGKAHDR